MSDVITLDGLEPGSIAGTPQCGKLVSINAPMLGKDIQVCQTDVQRMSSSSASATAEAVAAATPAPAPTTVAGLPRRRGRPKGATVANGAKRPNVGKCKVAKKIKTGNGRTICKCADQGNGQILAGRFCNMPRTKE